MGDLDRVKFGGETVDRRTSNMLREAQRIANEQDPSIGKLHLSQGCFCHGVAASAGTHSGAGAFDLSVRGYSEHQKEVIALSLRKVGFASWRRMPNQGPWPEHIHGIAIGSKELPSVAQSQVRSYLNGRNGLVGNRHDNQDRPDKILTWEQYKAKHLDDDKPDTGAASDPAPADDTATQGAGDPYDIDSGQGVSMTKDTDGDGLTDDFEKMSRTNPFNADSDGDGITDGQEFVSSGGRGTGVAIDADHDGVADWLETAALNSGNAAGAAPGPNGQSAVGAQTPVGTGAGVNPVGGVPAGVGGVGAGGVGAGGVGAGIGTASYAGGAYPGAGTYPATGLGAGLGNSVGSGVVTAGGVGTAAGAGLPAGATGSGSDPLDGAASGGGDPLGG
jgi:hypothetical protein